jgi:nucleoside 2-deoxyribosyltransferase
MRYLKGKRCYLSGPIENANPKDDWRIEPSKILIEEFGIDLFDPFHDPKQQWASALVTAREEKNYNEMARIANNFVRKDLSLVDSSDFLISNVPKGVPTVGTVHEIIVKSEQKKPVLLVCTQGKEHVAFWYFGLIPHSQMFGSWNDLYNYLREVNIGKHSDNYRWDYVCGRI